VVDESVDHRGGHDVVAEDLSPSPERHVRGDQDCSLFVAAGDQLEEQVRGVLVEGDVADLVDLCRGRHRSTYAESATMPRTVAGSLQWQGSRAEGLGIVTGLG
jgi:hypothetical protein